MKQLLKTTLILLILAGLAGGGGFWYKHTSNQKRFFYRTAMVKRGDLLATISATGTVEPEEVIDVGAQVAGRINSFGQDKTGKSIDYGSTVQKGTILAQIDDSLYTAEVALAEAQLQQAKAGLQRATADLVQLKVKADQAARDWARAQKLGPSEALAEASYDGYRSAHETALANIAVGEAAILQAKGGIAQAQAYWQRAQRNLSYCTITSPVHGIIIDRRVNIGQTVVASLNAPSLFLIAQDLKRMQLWVAVNEADIGNIYPGQPVSFTVDAYPGEKFSGEVGKVRLNATMTQNVVTYTVEVITDNSKGRLLPYLTANVRFELSRRTNVLLVPNTALRWAPQPEQMDPVIQAKLGSAGQRSGGMGERRPVAEAGSEANKVRPSQVWIEAGNFVRPIEVQPGLSDGSLTEVKSDEIQEAMEIILSERKAEQKNTTVSPFAPQPMMGHRH